MYLSYAEGNDTDDTSNTQAEQATRRTIFLKEVVAWGEVLYALFWTGERGSAGSVGLGEFMGADLGLRRG